MKPLFFLLIIVQSSYLWAQDRFERYNIWISKAEQASEQTNDSEALEAYRQAFSCLETARGYDYLQAAACANRLNNGKESWHWISEAVRQTAASKEQVLGLLALQETDALAVELRKQYDDLLKAYYQSRPNLEAFIKVEKLKERDQFIRKLDSYYLGISEEMKKQALEEYMAASKRGDTLAIAKAKAILFPTIKESFREDNIRMQQHIDSLNMVELMEITLQWGWQENAWLLLWHQRGDWGNSTPVWDFFKAVLDEEIRAGKLANSFWAAFEDYRQLKTSGNTIYGYHPGCVDVESVNEKRQSIGLAPLTPQEIEARNQNPMSGRMK
jgi:hypothetical protein